MYTFEFIIKVVRMENMDLIARRLVGLASMTQLVIIRQEVVIRGVKLGGIIQTNVIKVNIF